MNARPLSVQFSDTAFSTGDAIQHLVWNHSVSPEGYIVLDRAGLEERLPHRGPALCIDFGFIPLGENFRYAYSVSLVPKHSSETEGHFPEKTLLPGHWTIEKMCLTAALLGNRIIPTVGKTNRKYLPVFEEVYETRFKHPISPGDILVIRAEHLPNGIVVRGQQIQSDDPRRRPILKMEAFVKDTFCTVAVIGAVLVPVRG